MARYIDADALKLDIDLSKGASVLDLAISVIKSVKEAPTADVVPKSEYDAVVSAVDNSTKEFLKLHDDYQEQKVEIAALRGAANSYKMHYENAKAEKDALIKNYTGCMKDYVGKIFDEIEQEIKLALESNYKVKRDAQDDNDGLGIYVEGKIHCLRGIDDFISELKKKYIGGEWGE